MPRHGERSRRVRGYRPRTRRDFLRRRRPSLFGAAGPRRRALEKGDYEMEPDRTLKRAEGLGPLAVVRGVARGGPGGRRRPDRRRRLGHRDHLHHPRSPPGSYGTWTKSTETHPARRRHLDNPRAGGAIRRGRGDVPRQPGLRSRSPARDDRNRAPGAAWHPHPSEVMLARLLGAQAVKLFRAPWRTILPEGPPWSFSRCPLLCQPAASHWGTSPTGSQPAPARWEPEAP